MQIAVACHHRSILHENNAGINIVEIIYGRSKTGRPGVVATMRRNIIIQRKAAITRYDQIVPSYSMGDMAVGADHGQT